MRRKITMTIAAAAALWLNPVASARFASAAAAADDSRWGADFFPNVTLTTHHGQQVRFYDDLIKGKIVALDLIYTTCQYACPLETARLAQVQRLLGERMGRDVFFYSITIDPEHDTPAVLNAYAEKYRAGPGWLFLTGAKADIDALSRKLGLYTEPDPGNPDGHVPYLLVGNQATGQWMRNSATDNPKFLARTIGEWLNSWQTPVKALKSYGAAPLATFNKGQYTFAYHCAACHAIGGGTARIGPDLDGVTTRRERDWLRRFIAAPDKMNAGGDPIALELRATYRQARMPNLALSDEDVSAVIDYLDEQSRVADKAAAIAATTVASSSPASAELKAIVNAYVRIQQALHADAIEPIKNDARTIETEATKLGSAGKSIRSAGGAFQHAADLETARAVFGTLGDAIMIYARASGSGVGDGVTVAFCPMAQKYWLQKGENIQNPFYGKEMPTCGRVVAGLPELHK
jgi:protein SCO1/2